MGNIARDLVMTAPPDDYDYVSEAAMLEITDAGFQRMDEEEAEGKSEVVAGS